ncbi:MAG TPA: hypothetical protein PL096_07260 [Micropepsaceae bacterium]|nr:hypothetical protein [Micropepsaceae bacterium]
MKFSLIIASALLLAACSTLAPERATANAAAPFFGEWIGAADSSSTDPDAVNEGMRDIGIEIKAHDGDGFTIHWSMAGRTARDPRGREARLRDTTVSFKPQAGNIYHMDPDADVAAGETHYIARLEGQSLTITAFATLEDGKTELQTWRRTLTADGMTLEFTRVVDGELVRKATGTLVRIR